MKDRKKTIQAVRERCQEMLRTAEGRRAKLAEEEAANDDSASLRAQVATLQARVVELESGLAGAKRDATEWFEKWEVAQTNYINTSTERDRLTQQLAACEKQWRPIAEAPKDGTPVLLATDAGIHRVEWQDGFWVVDDQKHGPYPLRRYCHATHWMPLPPAPDSRTEEKQ